MTPTPTETAAFWATHRRKRTDTRVCDYDGETWPCSAARAEWEAAVRGARETGWRWLESTRELQTDTYGYDLVLLARDPAAFCRYAAWNILALYQEVGELGVEFAWKPWAVDEPFVNRERIIEECVDIGHFLGNFLVGLGVTDEEWEKAYMAKQDKNRRRKSSGTYSARKGSLGEGSDAE